MDIQSVSEKITPIFERHDVKFAGVFGSFARGEANEESDIDILISYRVPKSLLNLVALEHDLEDRLGRKVDVITEGGLSPYIKESVLHDLKIIYGAR